MTSVRTRTRMIERLRQSGIDNEAVLMAMAAVPRHIFVDEALAHRAYDDVALPIGEGQTISQPYIVARMCTLAYEAPKPHQILEIGAGCGYQAAVLSKLFKTVYSMERIASLVQRARHCLRELHISNVRLRYADGSQGIAEAAPFDAIIIAAATPQVPSCLLEQLAVGGRIIFPGGAMEQTMRVIEATSDGFVEHDLEKVRFVPMLPGVA